MIMQSLYQCRTNKGLSELIELQPTPHLFFDVFLELRMASLVNALAPDARSIKMLLSDDNE
jgi:hypothetical protein